MKGKIGKAVPYILLCGIFLLLIVLNIVYQDHWLDSDMAAEMIFSRLISEQNHLIASQDWFYSTEFRFLYTQLIMAPLFKVLTDWHMIRLITNVVFYILMMVSYFYFMKPLKVSKPLKITMGVLLLLPFSETMMTHMQMGNTYMSHVIILYFVFGMFLRLVSREKMKKSTRLFTYFFYIVLSVICGVSGVRYLFVLICPLIIASFIYLLMSDTVKRLFEEENIRVLLSGENINRVLKCSEIKYFYVSLVSGIGAFAGYIINVLWVSRTYVFQTYDTTNFISVYQGVLFERIQNAIGCLLMLFGYIPDKSFLSLRGIVSMGAFAVLAVLFIVTIKAVKREQKDRGLLGLFVAVAFCLNFFVFVFTTSTMVPRYYITIFIFVLPLICFYFEGEKSALKKLFAGIILVGCFLLGAAKVTLSFISVDKNEDKRAVAEFLDENNYHFGFSTYNNGNIITELTNGNVEIANVWNPSELNYFTWSSPAKYYSEDYSTGEIFLLLTVDEAYEYSECMAVQKGKEVYNDDAYIVYVYENRALLMECAE